MRNTIETFKGYLKSYKKNATLKSTKRYITYSNHYLCVAMIRKLRKES